MDSLGGLQYELDDYSAGSTVNIVEDKTPDVTVNPAEPTDIAEAVENLLTPNSGSDPTTSSTEHLNHKSESSPDVLSVPQPRSEANIYICLLNCRISGPGGAAEMWGHLRCVKSIRVIDNELYTTFCSLFESVKQLC